MYSDTIRNIIDSGLYLPPEVVQRAIDNLATQLTRWQQLYDSYIKEGTAIDNFSSLMLIRDTIIDLSQAVSLWKVYLNIERPSKKSKRTIRYTSVYILQDHATKLIKIGISVNPYRRFLSLKADFPASEMVYIRRFNTHGEAARCEKILHHRFHTKQHDHPYQKPGYTEFFNIDIKEATSALSSYAP